MADTRFRVHTIGNTFLVLWSDEDAKFDVPLARKVTARRGELGATYARETEPGVWRYSPMANVRKIRFQSVQQVSSLVLKMLRDDTMPKV